MDKIATTGILTIAAILASGIIAITFINISGELSDNIEHRTDQSRDMMGTDVTIIHIAVINPSEIIVWLKNTGITIIDGADQSEIFFDDTRTQTTEVELEEDLDTINPGLWDPKETIRLNFILDSALQDGVHKFEFTTYNGALTVSKYFTVSSS